MKKKIILFNILTHGNERVGLKVIEKIKKLKIDNNTYDFSFQIANEKAFNLKKRYIDQDLNRSFPGKKNGNHEEKIAHKIMPFIKSADLVIDIHSTTSNTKNTIIITKINKKLIDYIESIGPRYVVIMDNNKNSLISQAKIGISFEYGKENKSSTINGTFSGIKRLLSHLNVIDSKIIKRKNKINYFIVNSIVPRIKGYKTAKHIKNYKLVKKGEVYAVNRRNKIVADKNFYPILFGEKEYKNYFGFKGDKISL